MRAVDDRPTARRTDERPNPRLRTIGLAYDLIGLVVAGALVGWLLDRWAGTRPWGLLVATIVALVGGVARVVRNAERIGRRRDRRPV